MIAGCQGGVKMDLPKLKVRHGKFIELQGPPRTWEGISIAAATVELLGSSFSFSHNLADYLKAKKPSPDLRNLLLDGSDGSWVRGRIERVFLVQSPEEEDRGEKSGLYSSFIAVCPQADGTMLGIPFECTDYYLRTTLMFSEQEDPPPSALTDRIGEAFWSLLLADPHDLPEYRDTMYHSGAGIWMLFGIEDGQPFVEEQDDEPRGED